ncbi:MAG: hypothetical protein QF837_09135 [Acidimicrobiales bacterium]|nr:hypothetical protein [Acidimicrobiales bacterium]
MTTTAMTLVPHPPNVVVNATTYRSMAAMYHVMAAISRLLHLLQRPTPPATRPWNHRLLSFRTSGPLPHIPATLTSTRARVLRAQDSLRRSYTTRPTLPPFQNWI